MIATTSTSFEQRGARAALLVSSADVAREPLEFAAKLCAAQAEVTRQLQSHVMLRPEEAEAPGRALLTVAAEYGPELLAIEAEKRLHENAETARTRLRVYWEGDNANDFLSRAILQPFAESLRTRNITPDRVHSPGHCPFCGGAAWISFRKSASDAESGFRYLSCALCALDWAINRIQCPCCHEEDPFKLPVFQSDAHPNARIEACDTCHRYIKSIDLTKDARPVPIVDDLLSIAMDLWAVDEGYTRIEPGLAGL